MPDKLSFFGGIVAACACVAAVFSAPTLAQQSRQPKFTSGGIEVIVNRAVPPGSGSLLVLSLVMTNLADDDVAVVAPDMPMIIADTGGSATAEKVSGIALSGCGEAVEHCVVNMGLTPTVIDRHNSIIITMAFRADRNSRVCSVDFSMPLFIQRAGGGRPTPWRQITVGLPNIRVC